MIYYRCGVKTVNKIYNTQWTRYSDGAIWVLLSPVSLAHMQDFAEKPNQDKEIENVLCLSKITKSTLSKLLNIHSVIYRIR